MSEPVKIGQTIRHLGLLPRRTRPGYSQFPTLDAAQIPLLTRDQWRPTDLSRFAQQPKYQNGRNACASFGAIQAFERARDQAGLPYLALSPGSLYARVCGGRDAGSTLEDNLAELRDRGVCTENTVNPLTYLLRDLPANWTEEARCYRLTEAWDCPDFASQATALTLGQTTLFGILVGSAFNPASDGWIPYQRANGGHALCGEGLCAKPHRGTRAHAIPEDHPEHQDALLEAIANDAVAWGIRTPNSWQGWGIPDRHGRRFGIVPEAYFTRTPFTDGWSIRVVTHTRQPRP